MDKQFLIKRIIQYIEQTLNVYNKITFSTEVIIGAFVTVELFKIYVKYKFKDYNLTITEDKHISKLTIERWY